MATPVKGRPSIKSTSQNVSPQVIDSTSPQRRNQNSPRTSANESPLNLQNEIQSSDDKSDGEMSERDEVDQCVSKSPKIYPTLTQFKDKDIPLPQNIRESRSSDSLDDSFHTVRPECIKRPSRVERSPNGKKTERGYPDSLEEAPRPERRKATGPLIAIFLGFAIVVLAYFFWQLVNKVDIEDSSVYQNKPLKEIIQNLKSYLRSVNADFPQTRRFWQQLMSQINGAMVENPIQPAVILVIIPHGAERTASCLVHKVGQAVADAFTDKTYVMYDVKSEQSHNNHFLKTQLDSMLGGLVTSHAAIIHNIELIPGTAALMFHAYCDNENAPFKQALIMSTLKVNLSYQDLLMKNLGSTVDELLAQLWSQELRLEDAYAVVSRVANSPVLIKPMEQATLNKLCPL